MSEKAQFPELDQAATRPYAWDIVGKDDPLKIGHHVFPIFIAGLD